MLKSLLIGCGAVLFSTSLWAANAANGKAIFSRQCAGCHSQDASGNTKMGQMFHVRDLRSQAVQSQTDAQLFDIIARGKGKMPAYENNLGKTKIQDVVAYLRTLKK